MLRFFVGMVGTFLCSVEKICGETPVTFNVNNTGEVERNAGLHDMFRIVYLLPNNFSYLLTFSLYIFHQVSPHCDFSDWQPGPQASAPEGKKTAGGARFWEQATKEEKIMEPSQNCLWVFSHDALGFTHIVCPIAQQGCRYQTLPVLSKSKSMESRDQLVMTFAFPRFFSDGVLHGVLDAGIFLRLRRQKDEVIKSLITILKPFFVSGNIKFSTSLLECRSQLFEHFKCYPFRHRTETKAKSEMPKRVVETRKRTIGYKNHWCPCENIFEKNMAEKEKKGGLSEVVVVEDIE